MGQVIFAVLFYFFFSSHFRILFLLFDAYEYKSFETLQRYETFMPLPAQV